MTGQRKILCNISPTVLPGNDVLDAKSGERRSILVQATVLTLIPRTRSHEGLETRLLQTAAREASIKRAFA